MLCRMKHAILISAFFLAATATTAGAATCEDNFKEEGDPRNGAEYSASKNIPGLSVRGALGQLSAIAKADGFNVLGLESNGQSGKLTLEQAKQVKTPFLIHIVATQAADGSDVAISTRLNRGVTAKSTDMRKNMCGMLNRVVAGSEGEKLAETSAAQSGSSAATEITAILLARDLYREKSKIKSDQLAAELLSARYKGRKFLLDGQVHEPLPNEGRIDLWYHTFKAPGILNTIEDNNSVLWATVVCQMAPDQSARAAKLQGNDWAKLQGTVLRYELGSPDRLVLQDCSFR